MCLHENQIEIEMISSLITQNEIHVSKKMKYIRFFF